MAASLVTKFFCRLNRRCPMLLLLSITIAMSIWQSARTHKWTQDALVSPQLHFVVTELSKRWILILESVWKWNWVILKYYLGLLKTHLEILVPDSNLSWFNFNTKNRKTSTRTNIPTFISTCQSFLHWQLLQWFLCCNTNTQVSWGSTVCLVKTSHSCCVWKLRENKNTPTAAGKVC